MIDVLETLHCLRGGNVPSKAIPPLNSSVQFVLEQSAGKTIAKFCGESACIYNLLQESFVRASIAQSPTSADGSHWLSAGDLERVQLQGQRLAFQFFAIEHQAPLSPTALRELLPSSCNRYPELPPGCDLVVVQSLGPDAHLLTRVGRQSLHTHYHPSGIQEYSQSSSSSLLGSTDSAPFDEGGNVPPWSDAEMAQRSFKESVEIAGGEA